MKDICQQTARMVEEIKKVVDKQLALNVVGRDILQEIVQCHREAALVEEAVEEDIIKIL